MRNIDLESVRKRLASADGRVYWRSLEELADSAEFREMLHREFPHYASELDSSFSRRKFLKVMSASLALAGLQGCYRQPQEQIVPYVQQPEEVVPGKPLFYATCVPFCGYGIGALAESHMGRPTKIEGNPEHPASLGATNPFMQASVLTLYDPDRSQVITRGGEVGSTWQRFLSTLDDELQKYGANRGEGLRLLSGTITSPTLLAQIGAFLARYPAARWHIHEPVGSENAATGARQAFGQTVDPIYDFENADVIVSLESNFLYDLPGSLRYARQFIRRRRMTRPGDGASGEVRMNRLFVAEASPSITGAMADSRLPVRSSRIGDLARALLRESAAGLSDEQETAWAKDAIEQLDLHRGRCLILAGESQPPPVHSLAHALNVKYGGVGTTVRYIEPVAPPPTEEQSLASLATDMEQGLVGTLIIIESNPVYTAPADLDFAKRLEKVPLRIRLGLYHDETSFLCHWHIPAAHYLESWGDIRAFDGLASIIQPLILPLYQGRTGHELLSAMLGERDRTTYDIVRAFWRNRLGDAGFDRIWQESLHQGFIAGQTGTSRDVSIQNMSPSASEPSTQPDEQIELIFRPDPTVWDGSYANNAWLQELPKPLTKLTWDNAALMSAATYYRLGIDGKMIEIEGKRLAAMIVPGHADDCISLSLGYGRARAGRVARGAGFDAYALRKSSALWFAPAKVKLTNQTYPLAVTQQHFNLEGREIIQTRSVHELDKKHNGHRSVPLTLFPSRDAAHGPPYKSPQWGMSIDLSSCIGCNACVIACQAENNIPVVGKDQVLRSREMHWIRLDTYYSAEPGEAVEHLRNPQVYFQPLPCMHCETAPCELVCPVAATSHSDDGLNEMTYNRCIGTRYCSNNCPYKVRRFNFFEYNPPNMPETLKMQKNPDVTVRSRGVMEKCTYCVQRISSARIEAEKENRHIRDGEVVPACGQACPTQAIVFGDIADEKSLVHALKFQEPFAGLTYGLLDEHLATRPRTTYLAKIVEHEK